MNLKQRILSLLLSVVIMLTFMPALAFAQDGDADGQSISTAYTLRASDDDRSFTWEENDGYFYPVTGDKVKIGDNEYKYLNHVSSFVDDDQKPVLEYLYDFDFIYKKDGTVSNANNLKAGTYDVYITFTNNQYEDAYVCEVTVTENPYEYATYIPVKTAYTVSEMEQFRDLGCYYIPVEVGDKLVIKKKGESEIEYVAKNYTHEDEYGGRYDEVAFNIGTEEEPIYWWYELRYPDYITESDSGTVINFQGYFKGLLYEVPITIGTKTPAKEAVKNQAASVAASAPVSNQETYESSLPKVKISKLKGTKKAATVKWKKLNKKQLKKGVTNIEVWVCPNGAFGAADSKIVTVGKKKTSAKVKGLSKGTWFVKVRAIKKVGGVKYVGPWSKVKKVKIKK